jgi:hypothetical protein
MNPDPLAAALKASLGRITIGVDVHNPVLHIPHISPWLNSNFTDPRVALETGLGPHQTLVYVPPTRNNR